MKWLNKMLRRPPQESGPARLEYLTLEEFVLQHPEHIQGAVANPSHRILVIERDPDVYTYWESWRHWKFGRRAPEHVFFRDIVEHTHREAR